MDHMTKEAIRYLGYGKHAVDDKTLAMVEDSFRDLEDIAGRDPSTASLICSRRRMTDLR